MQTAYNYMHKAYKVLAGRHYSDMRNLSKNRTELLRIFLTNPEQSFYMQELGRMMGKKPGIFQRTINKMEQEGLLASEYKANARYFRANKEYPLFNELKSIIFKTVGIIGSIKDILRKSGKIEYAFIYGSYAKAKENHTSDIDLVIIGKPDEDRFIKEFDKLEKLLKREVNYKLYTSDGFKKEVRQKEPFLLSLLKDRKIMLIGPENELRKMG